MKYKRVSASTDECVYSVANKTRINGEGEFQFMCFGEQSRAVTIQNEYNVEEDVWDGKFAAKVSVLTRGRDEALVNLEALTGDLFYIPAAQEGDDAKPCGLLVRPDALFNESGKLKHEVQYGGRSHRFRSAMPEPSWRDCLPSRETTEYIGVSAALGTSATVGAISSFLNVIGLIYSTESGNAKGEREFRPDVTGLLASTSVILIGVLCYGVKRLGPLPSQLETKRRDAQQAREREVSRMQDESIPQLMKLVPGPHGFSLKPVTERDVRACL